MALMGKSYLPSLPQFFAGEDVVFSWSSIAELLGKVPAQAETDLLLRFLSAEEVRSLLENDVASFRKPNAETSRIFENQTSAIKITPSEDKPYNIQEIKSDTLWLSKQLDVDEVQCLRAVLLEWQNRPRARLLTGYSEGEIASLQDILGASLDKGHSLRDRFAPRQPPEEFEQETARRLRILSTYFREAAGLLQTRLELSRQAEIGSHNSHEDADPTATVLESLAWQIPPSRSINGEKYLDEVETILGRLRDGPKWSLTDPESENLWVGAQLQHMSGCIDLLLMWLRFGRSHVTGNLLVQWLRIMTQVDFFSQVEANPAFPSAQVQHLQALGTLTTIAFLDPATTIPAISQPSLSIWHDNIETVTIVHDTFFSAAEACLPQASPPALAWALILQEIRQHAVSAKEQRENHQTQRAIDQVAAYDSATGRRTSFGSSIGQTALEDIMDAILATAPVLDPVAYILRCTLEVANTADILARLASAKNETQPFFVTVKLQIIQELVSATADILGYGADVLMPQFAILDTRPLSSDVNMPTEPTETFIKDGFLVENVFDVAAARFPYEAVPFLRLASCLSTAQIFDEHGVHFIAFRLRNMNSYTQTATGGFADYHTVREDENLNLVALGNAVSPLQHNHNLLSNKTPDSPHRFIIDAGTIGEVISETNPSIIKWQHSYSGLSLLGKWLERYYQGEIFTVVSPVEDPAEVVSAIVGIFTNLLRSTMRRRHRTQEASLQVVNDILDEASADLDTDLDLAVLVFEILEAELQAYKRRPTSSFDTSILGSCIGFVTSFLQIRPNQFWSTFCRTSLGQHTGGISILSAVVSGVEAFNDDFTLLEDLTSLLEAMTKSATKQSIRNSSRLKSSQNKTMRLAPPPAARICASSLASITQIMAEVYSSLPRWASVPTPQVIRIVRNLSITFNELIVYTFGTGDPSDQSSLGAYLGPAAQIAIRILRPVSTGFEKDPSPVTQHILLWLPMLQESLTEAAAAIEAVLSLAFTLAAAVDFESTNAMKLVNELFDTIPILARLLLPMRSFTSTCAALIRRILTVLGSSRPVSLLGRLGSPTCVDLLNLLEQVERSIFTKSRIETWKLLTSLIGQGQQWLAVVALTGSIPRRGAGDDRAKKRLMYCDSFMDLAIDRLKEIQGLDAAFALPVLQFTTEAEQNWLWASSTLQARNGVFGELISYVSSTKVEPADPGTQSRRNGVTAAVTDLCSMHLHHAKSIKDVSVMKTVVPLINWLTLNAIDVDGYKPSLHTNLQKNLAVKFAGLKLSDLKRTPLVETEYGDDYYYNTALADLMLGDNPSWKNGGRDTAQSYSAELARANMNLSLVESEIVLFRSFQNLCVEQCGFFVQDRAVQRTMAHVVNNCLVANTQPCPTEQLFENLQQLRVDLSLTLVQKLVAVGAKGSDFRNLLNAAWNCTRFRNTSWESAINNDDLRYWRSTISVVLMTLQFHLGKSWQPLASDFSPAALLKHTEHSTGTILEVSTTVIGHGFRSVAASVQHRSQARSKNRTDVSGQVAELQDLALIVTMAETVLRMARMPDFALQLSERLNSTGCTQAAVLLYSWAYQLGHDEASEGLPYADTCLRFLAAISCLGPVAEELAVEGVLSRLLTARVTQSLQRMTGGVSQLDKRPHSQILFSIWSRGILPICLNLLYAVGPPIAAEVSVFLNQFPDQLKRASTAFVPPVSGRGSEFLTLDVSREAGTLALISAILQSFRLAGASAAVDSSAVLTLHGYDDQKKSLSEDIQDVVSMSESNMKMQIVPTTEKELKLNREGNALCKKIVQELRHTLICLAQDEAEEEKN